MKLKCGKCHKTFLYAARKVQPINDDKDVKLLLSVGTMTTVEFGIETRVCPYCHDLDIREVEEPKEPIESIQSVKINEVDDWLKMGYEIKDTYASTVTLVKRKGEV